MSACLTELIGLVVLTVTLLISLCLNVFFFVKHRAFLCKDSEERYSVNITEGEGPSQEEERYFPNLDHQEQQENLHNGHEQQENPIYGNIRTDRHGSVVCYEMMTMQHTRNLTKPSEPDLNYASLDLKMAKKHKKRNRHQQGHTQGRNKQQDQLPARLTPPTNAFLEVESDMDAHLPSRDTSTMVSHSSIYLNSQQIVQETEEMERERAVNMDRDDVGWEGLQRQEDGQDAVWCEDRKNRQGCSNGSVCTQLPDIEADQNSTDHFMSRSFSHDSVNQD